MFPLLSFPTELRLKVYTLYIQKAIIRIPGPPIANTLALLLTCRTIYQEASSYVMSTATFSLWSTKDLIYFLGSLSERDLRALRHIVVCGDLYGVVIPGTKGPKVDTFPVVFQCFPGLQLDTLTVRDGTYGPQFDELVFFSSGGVDKLISKGTGWKELRYFSPNKAILNFGNDDQLRCWEENIKGRDGGASVRILVGKELVLYTPDGRGGGSGIYMKDTTMSPPSWEFVDEEAPWREEDYIEYDDSKVVPRSPEAYEQRPVVVIVRRGEAAADEADVPRWFNRMLEKSSWREIREANRVRRFSHVGDRGTK